MIDNIFENENCWKNTIHPEKNGLHPTVTISIIHHRDNVCYESEHYFGFIAHIRGFHGKGFKGIIRNVFTNGCVQTTSLFYGTSEETLNETKNAIKEIIDEKERNMQKELDFIEELYRNRENQSNEV